MEQLCPVCLIKVERVDLFAILGNRGLNLKYTLCLHIGFTCEVQNIKLNMTSYVNNIYPIVILYGYWMTVRIAGRGTIG
jgi:hypothetical protein